jgi:transglutaminase-like putative cysteine protease
VTRRGRSSTSWFAVGLKAIAVALMIGTPLAGVWVASSLAAFANRATWLPVASGLLLFPGLPLAWEGVAALRARRRNAPRKAFLTFSDRMILRTLGINALFLAVLLAAYPERAFVALSARGDWMLDGHRGPAAEEVRAGLLRAAGAVEWIYRAAHDNPYREHDGRAADDHHPVPPPPPKPASKSTSTASPASASSPGPSSSSGPTAGTTGGTTPAPIPHRYPAPATLSPLLATLPPEAEATIEGVGRYIAAHETDPWLRVKALHDYVADRIAYDAAAYAAHAVPSEDGDATSVFRRKTGVCAGYAELLVALGKVTGDEIVYVVGDARSRTRPMEGEGHAWNAAKIDGAWYLLDATWDAGYVEGSTFTKRYSTAYLFAPPDQFAISHYPEDAKWQLLERPLSHADFFRRPVLAPAFFAHQLELVQPDRSQVTTGGALDVALRNPRGAFVMADFVPKGAPDGARGLKRDCSGDGHTSLRCTFPAAGTYDVRLYVNDAKYGTYEYAGGVEVNARP